MASSPAALSQKIGQPPKPSRTMLVTGSGFSPVLRPLAQPPNRVWWVSGSGQICLARSILAIGGRAVSSRGTRGRLPDRHALFGGLGVDLGRGPYRLLVATRRAFLTAFPFACAAVGAGEFALATSRSQARRPRGRQRNDGRLSQLALAVGVLLVTMAAAQSGGGENLSRCKMSPTVPPTFAQDWILSTGIGHGLRSSTSGPSGSGVTPTAPSFWTPSPARRPIANRADHGRQIVIPTTMPTRTRPPPTRSKLDSGRQLACGFFGPAPSSRSKNLYFLAAREGAIFWTLGDA